jgi:hypothetical protein
MNCKTCEKPLDNPRKKFCSLVCKNKDTNSRHKDYICQQKRALERKIFFIKKFGGKCSKCDYKDNLAALCFHHTDPTTKDFGVDARQFSNRSLESLNAELEKCVLLCSNCHMEEHYPNLNNWWE